MKFAVCECGAKIRVVQNLGEMIRCIDAHAVTHGKKESDPEKAEVERDRIESQLTRKIICQL